MHICHCCRSRTHSSCGLPIVVSNHEVCPFSPANAHVTCHCCRSLTHSSCGLPIVVSNHEVCPFSPANAHVTCHCCRSLTHDSWSLPVVAELVELTYLRLSCDEEGSMAPQLAGLHHLKELSYTTGSCDHVLGISTAAEVTKLEISYARVSSDGPAKCTRPSEATRTRRYRIQRGGYGLSC